jgi:hypothetical protein
MDCGAVAQLASRGGQKLPGCACVLAAGPGLDPPELAALDGAGMVLEESFGSLSVVADGRGGRRLRDRSASSARGPGCCRFAEGAMGYMVAEIEKNTLRPGSVQNSGVTPSPAVPARPVML